MGVYNLCLLISVICNLLVRVSVWFARVIYQHLFVRCLEKVVLLFYAVGIKITPAVCKRKLFAVDHVLGECNQENTDEGIPVNDPLTYCLIT